MQVIAREVASGEWRLASRGLPGAAPSTRYSLPATRCLPFPRPRLARARRAAFAPGVRLRSILLLVLAAASLPLHAQNSVQSLQATVTEVDPTSGNAYARGNVRARYGNAYITADEALGDNRAGSVTFSGRVVLTRDSVRLLADRLTYHPATGVFSAERVRAGTHPYYFEADSASGTSTEITAKGVRGTFGEPGRWAPTFTAGSLTYNADGTIRTEASQLGIGQAQPLPFPKFQQDLKSPIVLNGTANGGYRDSLGVFLEVGTQLPVAPGLRLGGDVGYYTERGLMAGPSGTYASVGDGGARYTGFFSSGYINDHGDKLLDVIGRRIPEDRGFFEWRHDQELSENLTLAAQLNYWRDSEVVRDFRPRAFFPVQQPDTYLEATYSQKNYFLSLFARFQPNSFQRVQERLPEVRFDLLPTALGGGFYQRFQASAAVLREDSQPLDPTQLFVITPTLKADRLDAYYGLERPFAARDYFTFTPVAGGRMTHYANISGTGGPRTYTRTLGEVGFDTLLRTTGTFAYKNPQWKIDGLRHLFTPRLSYRYIPEAGKGRPRIPQIDRETFATYLQPLGLGDVRNIDDLHDTNTLRLGFDNVLQTRDTEDGVRDLLVLNVANDFRFKRRAGERRTSEVHTELALMPARWMQVDVYQSFVPQTGTLREFNSGVTLHDGDSWSVRFANHFLRRELETYAIDGRARINESYDFLARLSYDSRKNRFNEQAYGITHNLGNTWLLSYIVSFYSGPRRESNFGLSIQIDTVRF